MGRWKAPCSVQGPWRSSQTRAWGKGAGLCRAGISNLLLPVLSGQKLLLGSRLLVLGTPGTSWHVKTWLALSTSCPVPPSQSPVPLILQPVTQHLPSPSLVQPPASPNRAGFPAQRMPMAVAAPSRVLARMLLALPHLCRTLAPLGDLVLSRLIPVAAGADRDSGRVSSRSQPWSSRPSWMSRSQPGVRARQGCCADRGSAAFLLHGAAQTAASCAHLVPARPLPWGCPDACLGRGQELEADPELCRCLEQTRLLSGLAPCPGFVPLLRAVGEPGGPCLRPSQRHLATSTGTEQGARAASPHLFYNVPRHTRDLCREPAPGSSCAPGVCLGSTRGTSPRAKEAAAGAGSMPPTSSA